MRNSEARQHKSFTPSITDILSRQNILIYHRRGPAKLSTQFMALSMGKKVNTYTSTLQGCILKMQGGCELGLEKQMFSFRRQREVEKLAKSSHPYQAMKSPEILSCPQDERKTPSILHLLILVQNASSSTTINCYKLKIFFVLKWCMSLSNYNWASSVL